MGLDVNAAYAQIKNLENSGKLTLPETQDTVTVGTIDPQAGTFTWSVPTLVQTTTIPPGMGRKTNTFINVNVGVISTKAVDLLLKFAVIPQKNQVVNQPRVAVREKTAAHSTPETAALRATAGGIVGGLLGENNGGVTISGFPTVVSAADHITVDAGLVCSVAMGPDSPVSPPVTNYSLIINIPGHQQIIVTFFVIRPPAVALGAFTIPALPMTIVYAPPQGKLLQNTVSYSDQETFTRTVTTSITSTNDTKTIQAYTASDLVGKVAGAITTVFAVVGGDPDAGGAGASVGGALSQLSSALFGSSKDQDDTEQQVKDVSDAAKQISSELSLVSGVLGAVDNTIPTNDGTISTEDDHTVTLTVSNMSQYSSKTGLGPGVGDRIVYMSNVRVVWMMVNGEVGMYILGFDAIGVNAVQDLQQEQQSLANGGTPKLGLDAATIKSLLSLDPLVPSRRSIIVVDGPPLIGPPRYIPAKPPERNGSGTGTGGDIFQASFDPGTEDKTTNTNTQTTISDAKPGWVAVLFGAEDNVETTTTATFTTTQSVDDKSDDKITSTITLFSEGADDAYDVKIFYDITFGTYVVLDANSPALRGVVGNELAESAA